MVQYWFYSAFDQFSVNFHWHDWEVLHVFLDVGEGSGDPETGDPTLLVASAHSRKVPNNEFLDPETDRASIISEVGSHSSALGINETKAEFERLPLVTDIADISNGALSPLDVPAAYGLPRRGVSSPLLAAGTRRLADPRSPGPPERHPRSPRPRSDDRRVLLGDPSPPDDIPLRETGLMFAFEGADTAGEADYGYSLTPMADLTIGEFTGPQLSFEFAVPSFAEDAVASHITTTGTPTAQPRFADPLTDVTDPRHRSALSERFDLDVSGLAGDVVGVIREATDSDDAPGSNGVDTGEPVVEGIALLESDPEAVPTFNGVVALRDVPAGEHRLTVNGAGVAPYGQRIDHGGDGGDGAGSTDSATTDSETAEPTESAATADGPPATTTVGVDGDVVVTPNEDAVKVRAEPAADAPGFDRVAVEDDVAGRVYDGLPADDEAEGAAVYVHREGAYTAEVEDEAGALGAYRVNPAADQSTATVREARTGKASLTSFLLTLLTETIAQASVFEDGDADGIDEVGVPDDTEEQTGAAADAVEDVLEATASVTGGPGGDTGGGDSGDDGSGGGPDAGFVGLLRALEASTNAARRANEAAQAGNAQGADNRLRGLKQRTAAIADALERNRENLPGQLPGLVERRVPQIERRIQQAIDADE
ncbi:hypothetical protein [Halobaculum halobium]|uniref:Uncharacterized protein n=1 Tax=Halobaculum halobium TaxID=3032281 RepID=A0ABD5TCI4_9EURY|nr:hypothetical protein [Halobaculum sp. SYNS20]